MKTPSETSHAGPALDKPVYVASSTCGLSICMNAAITIFLNIPPEHQNTVMTVSSVLGGSITWLVTYLWQSYGSDPLRVQNEKNLNRSINRAEKDLKDPNLSEDDKNQIREDYARYKALLREPKLLGQPATKNI